MAGLIVHDRGKSRDANAVAHVISAMELKESQVSALERMLYEKLGKKVKMLLGTDPSIIGGLRVEVDGLLIDRTLKKQLGDLRDAIKKGDITV